MELNKSSLWDQLSEDWIEQPPPSSPRLEPQSSPPQRSNGSPAQKSRIPRLSKRRASVGEPVSRRAPLADTSQSSINSRPHSSSPHKARHGSQMYQSGNSRPSTGSSAGSVVRHLDGSVVHRPEPAAQAPDWKKAAFKNQNLFSSTGLEELFKRPETEDENSPPGKRFIFHDDIDEVPSSPPFVGDNSGLSAHMRRASNLNIVRDLHAIAEETSDGEDPADGVEMSAMQLGIDARDDAVTKQLRKAQTKPNSTVSGSSVSCDLSPVFISKHNTANGDIGYAAFDPDDIPDLGSFVNCNRGQESNDSSFKRRPLSPSASSTPFASDSVAPSDSVSQIHNRKESAMDHALPRQGQLSPIAESAHPAPDVLPTPSESSDPQVAQSKNSSVETAFRAQTSSHPGTQFPDTSPRSGIAGSTSPPDTVSKPAPPAVQESGDATALSRTPSPLVRSIAGKKRKDARSGTAAKSEETTSVANREILRPRNMNSLKKNHSTGIQVVNDKPKASSQLSTGPNLVNSRAPDTAASREDARARALASEVASFQFRGSRLRTNEIRQHSFSTQDYLNEAMKIMSLIRKRKNVESEADSSELSADDDQQQELQNVSFSSQQLSRPPSREGVKSAWRSQAREDFDPQVLDHLKKYEETGDESFLVSSIVRSVRASERDAADVADESSEIFSISKASQRRRRSSDPVPRSDHERLESPLKTQTSHQSTGSGRTIATTSTQRARNMTTIAPEKVSHLIRDEEAGMRFDAATGTWVKQRHARTSMCPSSSTGTDGNALNEIPDLSVNEGLEQERSRVFSGQRQPWPQDVSELDESVSQLGQDAGGTLDGQVQPLLDEPSTASDSVIRKPATFDQERRPDFAATRDELHAEESEVLQTVEGDSTEELPLRPEIPLQRRRDQSVLFSSPPVSREWHAHPWQDTAETDEYDEVDHESSDLVPYRAKRNGGRQRSPIQAHGIARARSLSRIYEQHEISLLEAGPNGRQMSMSLSISTPVPERRSATVPIHQHSAVSRHRSFLNSLSPLSAFSMNQNDDRHKDTLALGRSILKIEQTHDGIRGRAAKMTEGLVKRLTDAEPNEPYWEVMSNLQLGECGFETLHSLDAFCPRLEALDASCNQLEHLQGVPSSLRQANFARNILSNLTSWQHLNNLQYVDLSNNRLSSLEGLSNLVHLRELKADGNAVSSIDGVLDLDGLLSLSLRNNDIQALNFETAALGRLTHVDVSGNRVDSIWGLSSLPALKSLVLDGNQLETLQFEEDATNQSTSLEHLSLARNRLKMLDLEAFLSLKSVNVDDNRLQQIDGTANHPSLAVVFLRNQKLRAGAVMQELSTFARVQELHLGGTPLPAWLPIEKPFLQLRVLDVSFTGIQALPAEFGLLTPNLQSLNLNSNHIKDLRPLTGIAGLRRLFCANNRVTRLRSLVRVLKSLSALHGGVLSEVDLRGNPVVIGFYHALDLDRSGFASTRSTASARAVAKEHEQHAAGLSRLVGPADAELDREHAERLDDDTKMKRRVYELLLAAKCPALEALDGLDFDRQVVERRDRVWDLLVERGVVEPVPSSAGA